MRVYKDNDIRSYDMCCHWIKYYRDLTKKESYNLETTYNYYFLNYLLRVKDLYLNKFKSERDPAAMKFYEGVMKVFYFCMDHPGYIPGIRMKTNDCFNFDYLIERTEASLIGLLTRAESEFRRGNQCFGSFFLGEYYGSKELIKICKNYLYLKSEK